jgi:hypothetical protein
MAGYNIDLDLRIKRVVLQKNFPTLEFEFLKDHQRDQLLVRVHNQSGMQYYEEAIDHETFPTDEFIQKMILIA